MSTTKAFANNIFLGPTGQFLRWLLIERAKLFKKFPKQRHEAFFVHDKSLASGQQLFLASVGIKPIQVNSYNEIYVAHWSLTL